MLISLMVVIISQCTLITEPHTVHLKYTQLLFVNYKVRGRGRNLTTTLSNEIIPQRKEKKKKKTSENGTLQHLKSLSRTKEMMAEFRHHFHLPLLCRRA